MSPPDEPRAHKGTTEKNPLLGPIVLVPGAIILVLALVVLIAVFSG